MRFQFISLEALGSGVNKKKIHSQLKSNIKFLRFKEHSGSGLPEDAQAQQLTKIPANNI